MMEGGDTPVYMISVNLEAGKVRVANHLYAANYFEHIIVAFRYRLVKTRDAPLG